MAASLLIVPKSNGALLSARSSELETLRAESQRLRRQFLERAIDLSIAIAGFPEAKPQSSLLRNACHCSAKKGYESVVRMMAKSSLSDDQAANLLPKLDELRSTLRVIGERAATPALTVNGNGVHERLTPRETEVLRCIAEGHSTKEIGAALGMSFKTAACHRYRIMDKLDIHDVASLVRYAIRAGLVTA
jgi:DNA-binding NarL/FixJ family response regulator